MRRTRFIFQLATLASDMVATGLAFFAAHRLQRALKPDTVDRLLTYVPYLILLLIASILVLYLGKRYHRRRAESLIDSLASMAWAITIANLIALTATFFLFKQELDVGQLSYPRGFLVYIWLFDILFISLSRYLLVRVFMIVQAHGYGRDRVLVVGSGDIGRMLVQKLLSASGVAHEVIGFVDTSSDSLTPVGVPQLGRPADLPEIIEMHAIDEVVIGLPEASHRQIVNLISLCEREKVSIKVFPDVFQIMATEVSVSDLGGLPLLTVRDVALRGWWLSLKRVFDLVFGSLALIFLSPLMLLIALLVKLESPGPVFYIQERMGLDAHPFPMLKFRSMRTDAEVDGPGWTTADDPRKTRVARCYAVSPLMNYLNSSTLCVEI